MLLYSTFLVSNYAQRDDLAVPEGPYLGQKAPRMTLEILTPGIVSKAGVQTNHTIEDVTPFQTIGDSQMQVFEEEVKFNNGKVILAGTLTLPNRFGIYPVVILLQGSGPVNRDEEVFGWKPFKIIADHLAQRGVAVLRYDSRGVGGSSGEAYQYTISDVADDVLEGIRYLKSRRDIDACRIGLLGHSQGGIVAPLVASRSKDVAFVICLSGTGLPGEDASLLQNASIASAEGASESQIEVLLKSHKAFFQLLRRNADIQELKAGVKSIVENSIAWKSEEQKLSFKDENNENSKVQCVLTACASPWFRFFLDYDPRPALEKTECPALLIFGELDRQVPAEENGKVMVDALQKKGKCRLTVKTFPRANHLFQEAKTGSPDEYGKLDKMFVMGFLEFISNWILEHDYRICERL